ncbi:MAG TPA: hypothetical protein DEH11_14150, partial [Actinobacteria bacterium]|nr:hypothetical protein [Actinomycetota bacterium]
MTDAAFRDEIRRNLTASARRRRRLYYRGLEAAADASAWLCGLAAAAWVTRDVATPAITLLVALRAAVAV